MQPSRALSIALLLVPVVLTNCARRPATSAVTAPPPTAASPVTDARAATMPEPGPIAAVGRPVATAERPSPRMFAPTPMLEDVHFDFDRSDIRRGDAETLDANAQWLKANPDRRVIVEGHCDEHGTDAYNLALGDRRARSASSYLVSHGVASTRITIISYGKERPTCADRTEACWTENRRVHFGVKRE